ncbi:DUF667 domain-containing protein [archaeon]|nr:MAG: DUF667 domain-containing protein [archaeon]
MKPFICTMPMRLDEGWNQIQFNLSDFTKRAYGTNYIETLRVQIHANCRIRRIYFSDRLYSEDELPADFKLFLPVQVGACACIRRARGLVRRTYVVHVRVHPAAFCTRGAEAIGCCCCHCRCCWSWWTRSWWIGCTSLRRSGCGRPGWHDARGRACGGGTGRGARRWRHAS